MSRSYKKNPYVTDHKRRWTKEKKRLANQSFRQQIAREEELPARPQHKKYAESWDICDYKWRMTKKEAIDWYNQEASNWFKKRYPTLEDWLKYWEKCYRRK